MTLNLFYFSSSFPKIGQVNNKYPHSAPAVHAFFDWLDQQQRSRGLLSADDFTKAMNFVLKPRVNFECMPRRARVAAETRRYVGHRARADRAALLHCCAQLSGP